VTEKGLAQQTSIGNRLLDAIPATEYEQMCLKMEHVSMDFNAVLFAPGEAIHHVFFPISGVVSLLAVVDDRLTVDVGMVGSEGMVGLSLLLGATTSLGWAIVQGGGEALRMKRADF